MLFASFARLCRAGVHRRQSRWQVILLEPNRWIHNLIADLQGCALVPEPLRLPGESSLLLLVGGMGISVHQVLVDLVRADAHHRDDAVRSDHERHGSPDLVIHEGGSIQRAAIRPPLTHLHRAASRGLCEAPRQLADQVGQIAVIQVRRNRQGIAHHHFCVGDSNARTGEHSTVVVAAFKFVRKWHPQPVVACVVGFESRGRVFGFFLLLLHLIRKLLSLAG